MTRTLSWGGLLAALVVLVCPLVAFGQGSGIVVAPATRTVVAALPGSPTNTSLTYIVTDAQDASDCGVGGGTALAHCAWDGDSWESLGSGGAGTGTVDGLAGDTGGTTTGTTVTIAGGTGLSTVRATDTITVGVDAGGIGATELASTAVTPGAYTSANITVDADGRVTAAASGSGLADGDKGDITVSGSGATWNIDAGVVGTSEIATDGVGSDEIVAGAVGTSELADTSVTPNPYTYTALTVDADGRITAASSGTAPGTQVTTGVTHPVSETDDFVVGGATCAGGAVCIDASTGDIISRVPGGRIVTEPDTTNPGAIEIEEPCGTPGTCGDNYISIKGTGSGFAANYICEVASDGTLTAGQGCMFLGVGELPSAEAGDFRFQTSGTQTIDADEYDVEPVEISTTGNTIVGTDISLVDYEVCNPDNVTTPPAVYTECTAATAAADCAAYTPAASSCKNYRAVSVPAGTYIVALDLAGTASAAGGDPDCAEVSLYGVDQAASYAIRSTVHETTTTPRMFPAEGMITVAGADRITAFVSACTGTFDEPSVVIQRDRSRIVIERLE